MRTKNTSGRKTTDTTEFSRLQIVNAVPPRGLSLNIEANANECSAVAQRLGLARLSRLEAVLEINPHGQHGLRVEGRMRADAVQHCVVTLIPLPVSIEETVRGIYMPPDALAEAEETDDGLGDMIEPISDGAIDVGELAVQHLALALDPYPRASNARFETPPARGTAKPTNPFAVLADWPVSQTATSSADSDEHATPESNKD